MNLSCAWYEAESRAPLIVLLHGWGFHAGVWASFIPYLRPYFSVMTVNWPGYGESESRVTDQLNDANIYAAIVASIKEKQYDSVIWLGWSLGGLHAMALAAHYPQETAALCLMAASPRFLQENTEKPAWTSAMPADIFQTFAQGLLQVPANTIERFIRIQCTGSPTVKQEIRYLQSVLAEKKLPALSLLKTDLERLEKTDYRTLLAQLNKPISCVLGVHDRLIPAALQQALQVLKADIHTEILANSAHQPFLSEPERCVQVLQQLSQRAGQ